MPESKHKKISSSGSSVDNKISELSLNVRRLSGRANFENCGSSPTVEQIEKMTPEEAKDFIDMSQNKSRFQNFTEFDLMAVADRLIIEIGENLDIEKSPIEVKGMLNFNYFRHCTTLPIKTQSDRTIS